MADEPGADQGVSSEPSRGPDDAAAQPVPAVADRAEPAAPTRGRAPLRVGIVVGALGVVFGDIGTSPLYALQTVFTIDHGRVRPTPADVYGVVSMIFWSITLIVTVKYVTILMRADNDGEGGVMALAALARRAFGGRSRRTGIVLVLAMVGASLFYGDSMITPAISVLSAVEGVKVAAPGLEHIVLPIAIVILVILFAVQRFGTGRVGSLFGPVMVAWFACLAVAGLAEVVREPGVLRGLSPTYAVSFIVVHPITTFIAMGAIVLCITGAEALYADMGHFGPSPIRMAWLVIVFPALTLNYLGQSALVLRQPSAASSPFFLLMPGWARLPMVILATAATVIASQAVISGAFAVSRQASQLGLLPPLTVRQTSDKSAGQVYMPAVNYALFGGVLVLMLVFRTSTRLATAYGIAVTGALLIDTVLLLVIARVYWRWPTPALVAAGVIFGGTELTFLSANLTKIAHGGWLPLVIATLAFVLMSTWYQGRGLITDRRQALEGSLVEFLDRAVDAKVVRVPGTGVFPHPTSQTTPLALRANLEHNDVLHERVVIVTTEARNVPHVTVDATTVDHLGTTADGVVHVTLRYGFFDRPDIPEAIRRVSRMKLPELDVDPDTASYFLSRATLRVTRERGMMRWRKQLFVVLARNAATPAQYFALPIRRTVIMGSEIDL